MSKQDAEESIVNPDCREYILCPRGNKILFSLKDAMMIPLPGASNVYPMPAWCRFLWHTLFLLSIRRIPNHSESHRSTRGAVSWSLVLAWRHQQRHHPALSSLSRPCKDSISTCFACSALVARLQAFR